MLDAQEFLRQGPYHTIRHRIVLGISRQIPPRIFDGEDGGQDWIRTSEGVSQRIYSPPRLATSVPTREKGGALYARVCGAASD